LTKKLSILPFVVAVFATVSHSAEPVSLPLANPPFAERFDGDSPVPVSGNLIVGVSVGRALGHFSPRSIRVNLGSRPRSGHLCLSVASRDGRYAAENLYGTPENLNGPASFEYRTHHLDRISGYRSDQVAVLIRDVPNCVSSDMGEILPNVFVSESGPLQMVVYLNAAPERVSAGLSKDGEAVSGQSRCEGNRNVVSIAFSAICTLTLPPSIKGGIYRLRVSTRERFEVVERTVAIRLSLP